MLIWDLVSCLDNLLQPSKYKDYCPNGLQIQGTQNINKVICGVSLTEKLIDKAIEHSAQAIIVHHGVFWNKDNLALIGLKYQRIAKLIKHDINLLAYHLPLDCHGELGNNAQLAKLLEISVLGQTLVQDLLWYGEFKQTFNQTSLIDWYYAKTQHEPVYFGLPHKLIQRVAWCTGGADSMFSAAIELGVDCFISGEVSEPIKAMAEESSVAYLVGGHYVTERYGTMALSQYINDTLGLESEFIELYNPI